MAVNAIPSLEEFCRDRHLWLVVESRRERRLWRHVQVEHTFIYFMLADGALVEIDASTVDWSVTVTDGHNGSIVWERWYDVYAHAWEAGGDVPLQSLRSIQQFAALILAGDGINSLDGLEFKF